MTLLINSWSVVPNVPSLQGTFNAGSFVVFLKDFVAYLVSP